MSDVCAYCGTRLPDARPAWRPAPAGPCPGCDRLLEDDLTAAATRIARPGTRAAAPVPAAAVPTPG